jgi:hypothetical protein
MMSMIGAIALLLVPREIGNMILVAREYRELIRPKNETPSSQIRNKVWYLFRTNCMQQFHDKQFTATPFHGMRDA